MCALEENKHLAAWQDGEGVDILEDAVLLRRRHPHQLATIHSYIEVHILLAAAIGIADDPIEFDYFAAENNLMRIVLVGLEGEQRGKVLPEQPDSMGALLGEGKLLGERRLNRIVSQILAAHFILGLHISPDTKRVVMKQCTVRLDPCARLVVISILPRHQINLVMTHMVVLEN